VTRSAALPTHFLPNGHMPQHAKAGIAARPTREMIGEGTFGKAYLVRSSSGQQVVIKESEAIGLSTMEKEAMLNEALILKRLQHPAIIAYRQAYIRGDMFCIEMEWAAGGDLRSFIKRRRHEKRWLTETTIGRHLWQLTSALAYCHKQHLLHRDLKSANIFLDALDHIKVRIRCTQHLSLRRSSPARVTCRSWETLALRRSCPRHRRALAASPHHRQSPWPLSVTYATTYATTYASTRAPTACRPRPSRNVAPRCICVLRCARACRTPARRTSGHSAAYSSS